MKINAVVAVAGLALSLASCSGQPECTDALIESKGKELTTAIQAAMAKDSTKGQQLLARMQEVVQKNATADKSAACKAIDEIIAAAKQ